MGKITELNNKGTDSGRGSFKAAMTSKEPQGGQIAQNFAGFAARHGEMMRQSTDKNIATKEKR